MTYDYSEFKLLTSKDGNFKDRCSTIPVEQLYDDTIIGFKCQNYDGSRYIYVPRKECLELYEAGKIKSKFVNGIEIINEVSFKGNPANTGYGAYFKANRKYN